MCDFADPRAVQTCVLHDVAEQYANAEFPAWFYESFSRLRLVAPI